MDKVILSNTYEIVSIYKKSSITALKNASIGDLITFSLPIEPVGRGCRGNTYATYVEVKNERTGDISKHSLNVLPKSLEGYNFSLHKTGD